MYVPQNCMSHVVVSLETKVRSYIKTQQQLQGRAIFIFSLPSLIGTTVSISLGRSEHENDFDSDVQTTFCIAYRLRKLKMPHATFSLS
mmetsp:Transcript_6081/g.8713  ORF Transcript_6081/g.8713 Transcript_6081/m.8713 type:complete len:88 (-) Transcript_6081:75-338(-)